MTVREGYQVWFVREIGAWRMKKGRMDLWVTD